MLSMLLLPPCERFDDDDDDDEDEDEEDEEGLLRLRLNRQFLSAASSIPSLSSPPPLPLCLTPLPL